MYSLQFLLGLTEKRNQVTTVHSKLRKQPKNVFSAQKLQKKRIFERVAQKISQNGSQIRGWHAKRGQNNEVPELFDIFGPTF